MSSLLFLSMIVHNLNCSSIANRLNNFSQPLKCDSTIRCKYYFNQFLFLRVLESLRSAKQKLTLPYYSYQASWLHEGSPESKLARKMIGWERKSTLEWPNSFWAIFMICVKGLNRKETKEQCYQNNSWQELWCNKELWSDTIFCSSGLPLARTYEFDNSFKPQSIFL